MSTTREQIAENIARVRDRIAAACARSGRDPAGVHIVAVTKTHPPETVDAVIAAGVRDIGENRIQEYLDKRDTVRGPCRWHMVGTLQRNKATKVIGEFDLIHSLDSLRLAATLDRLGGARKLTTRVLIQVNTSGEDSKHGFAPGDVRAAAGEIGALAHLELAGLMTIGPLAGGESAVRAAFGALRRLCEEAAGELGRDLPVLSMGMSDDFDIAVEEGATHVRLGRVLLGPR